MILSRQHFDLGNKCVVEKLVIQTPFRFPALFQDEACFIHIQDGQALFASPSEKINIDTHESILLRCGRYFADLIQHTAPGTCEIFAVHLYPQILKAIYVDDIPPFIKTSVTKTYLQKIENEQVISQFINSLTFYFENPQLVHDELLRLKLKELILLLLQTKSACTIIDLVSQLFTPRQATISEVITTHRFTNLSIDELATLSGLSTSSFKREFFKQYNDTPANYIRKERLQYAAELLTITSYTVSEIAFQTGFDDIAHFSRTFKKYFELTPTNYRLTYKTKG